MSDRHLPYAGTVTHRAVSTLSVLGNESLADELATVCRAVCDLAQALSAEREASSASQRAQAQQRLRDALCTLRSGLPDKVADPDPTLTDRDELSHAPALAWHLPLPF